MTKGEGAARGNNTMMQEGIWKGTTAEKGRRRFNISQGVPLILSQGVGTCIRKPRRNLRMLEILLTCISLFSVDCASKPTQCLLAASGAGKEMDNS